MINVNPHFPYRQQKCNGKCIERGLRMNLVRLAVKSWRLVFMVSLYSSGCFITVLLFTSCHAQTGLISDHSDSNPMESHRFLNPTQNKHADNNPEHTGVAQQHSLTLKGASQRASANSQTLWGYYCTHKLLHMHRAIARAELAKIHAVLCQLRVANC